MGRAVSRSRVERADRRLHLSVDVRLLFVIFAVAALNHDRWMRAGITDRKPEYLRIEPNKSRGTGSRSSFSALRNFENLSQGDFARPQSGTLQFLTTCHGCL